VLWLKLFFLFCLLLPTQLGKHFWLRDSYIFGLRVDYLSPTLYLIDLLALALVLIGLKKHFHQFSRKVFGLLAIFIFLAGVNLLVSKTPLISFFAWIRWTGLFFLGAIIVQEAFLSLAVLKKTLPWVVVFEFILGLAQVVKQGALGGPLWFLGERSFTLFTPGIARGNFFGEVFLRPYGTFSHPNSLAGFILVGLILIFGRKPCFWEKVAIALGFVLLLLTFSRTVWLAAFLEGLIFLLIKLRRSPHLTFRFWSVALGLPFLTYFFTKTMIDPSSYIRRIALAKFALVQIKASPLLGVGLANFVIVLSQGGQAWEWLYWLQPVHNIFLLIATETGLLGLSLFILLIINTIKKTANYSLLMAILAILFIGLFDHYWLTLVQNQYLFVLVLSLSLGLPGAKIKK